MNVNKVEPAKPAARWTGRHVVIGMFVFGITMVAGLWLYWELYTRPFRELQNAINTEFPGSSPRAIGGKEKSHRTDNPATLRIIVRVYFDPNAETDRSDNMAAQLAAIAREHHDVSQYDNLEIHLEQRVPEAESRHWSVSKPVSEWETKAESG
ncbi:MAG: hypothetical protein JNG89_17025 [Planctomycetaceae bacterium]|nr:hypothetical protein [Planctomycetaceae bacterium]